MVDEKGEVLSVEAQDAMWCAARDIHEKVMMREDGTLTLDAANFWLIEFATRILEAAGYEVKKKA